MQTYIGTKIVQAEPQTRESDNQVGYRVVYPDGYESWSPFGVFDGAYRPCDAMTFGLAIEALKLGKKVARAGWNGKGMWLYRVCACDYTLESYVHVAGQLPWIGMKTAGDEFVPWLASQTDMLAEDWTVVA